jgi:hypothetical protein
MRNLLKIGDRRAGNDGRRPKAFAAPSLSAARRHNGNSRLAGALEQGIAIEKERSGGLD